MDLVKIVLDPIDINRVTNNLVVNREEDKVSISISNEVADEQYIQSFDRGYDSPPSNKFVKKSSLMGETDLIELKLDLESKNQLDVGAFIIQYSADKRLSNDHRTFKIKQGKNKITFQTSRHAKATSFRFRLKFGKQPFSLIISNIVVIQKSALDFEDLEMERIKKRAQQMNALKVKTSDSVSEALSYGIELNKFECPEEDKEGYDYLVTVIVPVYNTSEYLPNCLNSLLNQTIKDIEIIAINDGSKDNSLEVLNEISKSNPGRIKIFDQVNKGLGAVRNRGIDLAKGRYLMFLDSDDAFTLSACEKLAKYACKHRADSVVGRIGWDIDGKITPQENIDKKLSKYIDRRYANLRNDTGAVFINVVCCLYSSRLIKDNNIRFPEGTYWEDMPFSLQTWYHAKQIGHISDIIYLRSKREGSITQTYNFKTLLDRIKIARIIDSYFSEYKLHNLYNYFTWTMEDIENRIELIESPEDKKKAIEIWSKEKPELVRMKEEHEKKSMAR